MSVLKWIWGLLQRLFKRFHVLVTFLLDIVSSFAAWVIAGIAWLVHQFTQYVGDYMEGLFENLSDISLTGIPVSPLGKWLAHDVVALDVAWECLVIYFSVWVASRIARSSFTIIRLILDLI